MTTKNQKRQELRRVRRAAGLCECGRKPVRDHKTCSKCLRVRRDSTTRLRRDGRRKEPKELVQGQRQRLFARRTAKGLCAKCGRRKVAKNSNRHCGTCLRQMREAARARRAKDPAAHAAAAREWYQQTRLRIIDHYTQGTRTCACCGLDDGHEFLCLDHVNGDGSEHRKTLKASSGAKLFSWIIRNNFPDTIQVLCYNCNCAKGFSSDGICPHQRRQNGMA